MDAVEAVIQQFSRPSVPSGEARLCHGPPLHILIGKLISELLKCSSRPNHALPTLRGACKQHETGRVQTTWLSALFGCQASRNEFAINNGIPHEFAINNAHVVDFAWNRELHDPSTYRIGEVVPIQN